MLVVEAIEAELARLVADLHRLPAHWTDQRAEAHADIDRLLDQWESLLTRPEGTPE